VSLIILGRRLSYVLDRKLGRHGYNHTQAAMILALTKHPGLTAQDLARPAWVEPSSVTRALQALERRGLVARQAHPTDGRAMVLHLTERGTEEARLIVALMQSTSAHVESGLSAADVEAVRHALPTWFQRTDALWTSADVEDEEGAQTAL
jgi:MarR family transcriptional regulator, transcriptional regulator for hemolysin